ncbi:MAG: hypothetical protein QXE79_01990 [Candidatus Bathyarchaeia archaeon]
MGSIAKLYTAPLSISLTIIVLVAAFHYYSGASYEPPIIFNPKFKYFTFDVETNGSKPYLWEVAVTKGPGDLAYIGEETVDGRRCLGLHVYQDGLNDSYNWVTIHVKQEVAGPQWGRLYTARIGLWLYANFSYKYFEETNDPRNAFGLEVNDGTHILWIIFSDKNEGVYELKNHRIVVVKTPLKEWIYREINISREYEAAGWDKPKYASFILILGSTKLAPGYYSGYFGEISILEARRGGG